MRREGGGMHGDNAKRLRSARKFTGAPLENRAGAVL